ncbi:MAG: PilZ domain-containing protein [Lachnospiraceae bacterium]|nr:PilZ domain-containing protein [Lachnospiraceae bacterium]
MQNLFERRKFKRLPINIQLLVNKVYKQDNDIIEGIDADVEVFDISKTGIGFISSGKLPLNYYFDTRIELPGNDFFMAVIKIVRIAEKEDKILYGAEFVGLAPFLALKIDAYERSIVQEDDGNYMHYNFE